MRRVPAVVAAALIALIATGCQTTAEPDPGSFHLTAEPALAPFAMTVREDGAGGPSGRSAQFAAGDVVVMDWTTLPLPRDKWIEVNGQDCDGKFTIEPRMQTVLVLTVSESACRVQVVGSNPEPT